MLSDGKQRTPIKLRFCDTDLIGHINNVAFAAFAESGRVDLFNTYQLPTARLILAHISIDFKAQMRLDDDVWIDTWVESLGTSSMQLKQEIFAEGVVVATAETVIVHFDYEANRSSPVPSDLREKIRTTKLQA